MVDESGVDLKDYKFFVFNGEVKSLFIATDIPHDTRFDFFDRDFNHLPSQMDTCTQQMCLNPQKVLMRR